MTDGNWNWLETTEKLQIEAFGNDLRALEGKERDDALVFNAYALMDEIGEALDETSWKPWDKKNTGVINREAFLGELVDAAHFLANLLLLGDFDEHEFWHAYRAKQNRNRIRQQNNYDALKNKCPGCNRELDKPGAYSITEQAYAQQGEKHIMTYMLQCAACSHKFNYTVTLGEDNLPGMTAE